MTFRLFSRAIAVRTVAVAITSGAILPAAHAQHGASADIPISPADMTPAGYAGALRALAADSVHAMRHVVNGHLVMRNDSVRAMTDSLARLWFASLHDVPVNRYQQLPMAIIAAYKGDDAEVQRRISAVLATPGLTTHERSWALGSAVQILLRTDTLATIARIQIARGYFAQLATIPLDISGFDQFQSLVALMEANTATNNVDQAIHDGLQAFAIPSQTNDYSLRASIVRQKAVVTLALLLSGQPGGMARVDSLRAVLTHYITLPPALADADPALRRLEGDARKDFDANMKKISFFGKPAAPFVATHWFNQPVPATVSDAAPNARIKSLDDGVIRIIGMGWFTCPWCQKEMHEFKRMQRLLPPGVELLYYEFTVGNWGSNLVDPAEEVEHLRHYNVDRKKYTYPIAIWAGPKDSTPDGGVLPRTSPMLAAYAFNAGPTILVVDGHGIVRNYTEGYDVYEGSLKPVIEQLIRERDHPGETFTPSAHPVSNRNATRS